MDPAVTVSVISLLLAVVGCFSGMIANMRLRSACRNEALGLDISIQKRFNDDLANMDVSKLTTESDSE